MWTIIYQEESVKFNSTGLETMVTVYECRMLVKIHFNIFYPLQLLDSFTIAVVMVLSFIFLRARYKIINFMGVALSIVGILTLVLADVQGSRAGKGGH